MTADIIQRLSETIAIKYPLSDVHVRNVVKRA